MSSDSIYSGAPGEGASLDDEPSASGRCGTPGKLLAGLGGLLLLAGTAATIVAATSAAAPAGDSDGGSTAASAATLLTSAPACAEAAARCTEAQEAALVECAKSCDTCDIGGAKLTLDDCTLLTDDAELARHSLDRACANPPAPPPASSTTGRRLLSSDATEQPCSELQHAVINHCAAHCNTCDTAGTDTVLGDCVVTELWGENVLGTTKATEDCLEEQLDTEAAEAAAAEARRADNLCSALQHAVINHCINHCGTCDVPTTETVLGSCELEGPWGLIEGSDGTRIMAAAQVSSVCAEQLNAAQHRAANHCTELQHAVINHCAAHCGTCVDVAKTDVILGDCVVDEIGGTVLGTAKVAEDCAGEQLVAEAHHEDSMCNDLQRSVISHCINHCDTCEFHGKGRTDLILDGCEVEATDGTHIKGAVRAAQICGELSVEENWQALSYSYVVDPRLPGF
eukprot:COSAG04_NODE_3871_length_2460_cov_1.280813_1_plen_454_part_10